MRELVVGGLEEKTYYFACGVSTHCSEGQKIVVNVAAGAPAPEPELEFEEGPIVVGLGEACNPTVSPAFQTICDDGLACEVPAGSGLGASGVCVEN